MKETGQKNIICFIALFFVITLFSSFTSVKGFADVPLEISIEPAKVIIEIKMGEDPAVGYIHQKMYPARLRAPLPSGYRLEGTDRYLYDQLRTKIAKVAAGELSEAIFSFPASAVYDKVNYSAADLGVESIMANGAITPEARTAISSIVTQAFDYSRIFSCLLADCPYEMYWYDKTVGCIVEYPSFRYTSSTVFLDGNVTFSLAVSEEYRAAGVEPTEFTINGEKVYRYCNVGTQWGQSVTTAVRNARAIVNRYEELDDYERLTAYKDDIRSLTGYNYDAANGHDEHGNEIHFGNPWQLIWVFDGDPETKVVCEGYSKAFQYLNDMSSSTVTVISVTGTMDGGAHMWNVVKMDDGQNYMADVTNCFTDDSGHTYRFLDGYKELQGDDGYLFDDGHSGTTPYIYDDGNEIHNSDDLLITDTGYLDTKIPAPVFAAGAGAGTYRIGDELGFTLQENQETEYDSFIARVTHVPEDPETTGKIKRELFEGPAWIFGPAFHEAGSYRIQFAGKCGNVTSLWSDPIVLTPLSTADLGRIGFTATTCQALKDIGAGDMEILAWGVEKDAQGSINGYTIRLTDVANGETWIEQAFGADETETEILWAFCPETYILQLIPDIETGYTYSCEPIEIILKNSGKEWLISEDGVLTKYFGPGTYPIVPETLDGKEVLSIGPGAFARSKARYVRIPSVVGVDAEAFSGCRIEGIVGYENSEAETVAEAAGIDFESLGVKPNAAIADISSGKGYIGYSAAIRLQEEADAVLIKETKKQLQCDGTYVLIPLDTAGELEYTLAAIKDGVRGDFGNTVSITVEAVGNQTLKIPDNTRNIESEAFRGIKATVIRIPGSVQTIGNYAFADNSVLKIVQISNLQAVGNTVFSNCNEFVWCFADAAYGFSTGKPFLMK